MEEQISELLAVVFDDGLHLSDEDAEWFITDGVYNYVRIAHHPGCGILVHNMITDRSFMFSSATDAIIEAIAQTAKAIAHLKLKGAMQQ